MYTLRPPKDIIVEKTKSGHVPLLILKPKNKTHATPGILWIHGGGYILGMKEMVYMSRAIELVQKYHVTVISPGYRLAFYKPYPAAFNDCYEALLYLKEHCNELAVDPKQIMVGGESAGGGLAAAVSLKARDEHSIKIAYLMPLYPMLDNFDTASSRNNHGKVWNTTRNHFAWKLYLRKDVHKEVSPYASPSRETDYHNLPPVYTFIGKYEPFYDETITFIDHLKKAGVEAKLDIYDTNIHAFDMLRPELDISKEAIQKFNEHFEYAMKHYYSEE